VQTRIRVGERGFTLIEVMVSLAIISILSMVLFRVFIVAAKIDKSAYDIDKANATAINVVERLKNNIPVSFHSMNIGPTGTIYSTDYYKRDWSTWVTANGEEEKIFKVETILTDRQSISEVAVSSTPPSKIEILELENITATDEHDVNVTNPATDQLSIGIAGAKFRIYSQNEPITFTEKIGTTGDIDASGVERIPVIIRYAGNVNKTLKIYNSAVKTGTNEPLEIEFYIISSGTGVIKIEAVTGNCSVCYMTDGKSATEEYNVAVKISWNLNYQNILNYQTKLYRR